ncbi:unnamed protein product [Polarella glacialis]|nr:unnamed protein product [Polarella glacialis]
MAAEEASGGSVSLSPGPAAQMTSVAGPNAAGAVHAQRMAQQAMQSAPQEVSQEFTSQAMSGASRVIGNAAQEVRIFVESNPYSVTALSFIGGLVLALVSFVNLLNIFSIIAPLKYILQIYQLLFGLIICLIDGPGNRLPTLRAKVIGYASFLHTNTSRALFYMFIACIEGEQAGIFRQLVAWYFAAIAVGHLVLTWAKPRNLAQQDSRQQGLVSEGP